MWYNEIIIIKKAIKNYSVHLWKDNNKYDSTIIN